MKQFFSALLVCALSIGTGLAMGQAYLNEIAHRSPCELNNFCKEEIK